FQILEADRSQSDRLLAGRSPRPPACLQTSPPAGSPLPLHQKYPCGREWSRVLRPFSVSKLCGLAPCPLYQPLLSALLPFLWPAYRRAWNDRLGPPSGGEIANRHSAPLTTRVRVP